MVNLTRIYTRTGDGGSTHLGNGQVTRKTDPRVVAYGAVDETNAAIGVAIAAGLSTSMARLLRSVQNDLFDLGADLSVPEASAGAGAPAPLRTTQAQVQYLESAIDEVNADLSTLRSFVLPGGGPGAAQLHVARTVCRRAESCAWALVEASGDETSVNPQALAYLNRLSDLLFVLSRSASVEHGESDVLWRPGGEDAS